MLLHLSFSTLFFSPSLHHLRFRSPPSLAISLVRTTGQGPFTTTEGRTRFDARLSAGQRAVHHPDLVRAFVILKRISSPAKLLRLMLVRFLLISAQVHSLMKLFETRITSVSYLKQRSVILISSSMNFETAFATAAEFQCLHPFMVELQLLFPGFPESLSPPEFLLLVTSLKPVKSMNQSWSYRRVSLECCWSSLLSALDTKTRLYRPPSLTVSKHHFRTSSFLTSGGLGKPSQNPSSLFALLGLLGPLASSWLWVSKATMTCFDLGLFEYRFKYHCWVIILGLAVSLGGD